MQIQTAAQFMHSALPPHYNPRDTRHTKNSPTMEYKMGIDEMKDGKDSHEMLRNAEVEISQERADIGQTSPERNPQSEVPELELKAERTGVTHLVHCWFAQGQNVSQNKSPFALLTIVPQKRMVPSSDMNRTGKGAMAVKSYFLATQRASAKLAAMFRAAYPEYYEKYRKAFSAGVWIKEDRGPWVGRAIVWKLQVGLHKDGLDEGPALCFPCGDYSGGELYLPDLRAKLQ